MRDNLTVRRETTLLRPDEPITKASEDRFNRVRLVTRIADHIRGFHSPEPIVLAINAPWGAGKSSFLNLLEERLCDGGEQAPIVVRFNPWHFNNLDELVRAFFVELALGIGAGTKAAFAKEVASLLTAMGALVGVVSSGGAKLFKTIAEDLANQQSLPTLKAELNELLKRLPRRVVVFIDDIDRLERDALRLLFRLVRLNADFQNTTYVLAFDRLVVERHLDDDSGIRGRNYLEKIVQISFDIPKVESVLLYPTLFEGLEELTSALPRAVDERRWANLFYGGFKQHFRTARDVNRYLNAVCVTFPAVAGEVDVIDFLGLELLRVFHPEVYEAIQLNKQVFLDGSNYTYDTGIKPKREELRAFVHGLFDEAGALHGAVKLVIGELFTVVEYVDDGRSYNASFDTRWRCDRRLRSPEMFDKYFLLGVPSGEVSEQTLERFVESLGDSAATNQHLSDAVDRGWIRRLLERIEDFIPSMQPEQARALISILFARGDEFVFEQHGVFDVFAHLAPTYIVRNCLRRLEEHERAAEFIGLLAKGRALFTMASVVSRIQPNKEQVEQDLTEFEWEQARDVVVEHINASAKDGRIWSVVRLRHVLAHWQKWAGEAVVREAIASHVEDDQMFVEFLQKCTTTRPAQGGRDRTSQSYTILQRDTLNALVGEGFESRLHKLATHPVLGDSARKLLEFLKVGDGEDAL